MLGSQALRPRVEPSLYCALFVAQATGCTPKCLPSTSTGADGWPGHWLSAYCMPALASGLCVAYTFQPQNDPFRE